MAYYNYRIVDLSYENTIVKVTEELKKEGFGVLTEIDVKETLKKKLNVNFRKYKILGACNPPFAYQALMMEENIGALMPCNVIVQEKNDGVIQVSVVNPMESMQTVENQELAEIAGEISKKLINVLKNI